VFLPVVRLCIVPACCKWSNAGHRVFTRAQHLHELVNPSGERHVSM